MIPDRLKIICRRELPGGARQRIVALNSLLSRLGENSKVVQSGSSRYRGKI